MFYFLCSGVPTERYEKVWVPEVAFVLRDLVLKDHVVSKRLPRDFGNESVVLMAVGLCTCSLGRMMGAARANDLPQPSQCRLHVLLPPQDTVAKVQLQHAPYQLWIKGV